ncbi:MAG: OmpW family outer membrane protein [Pseudomonadota bacterium]
MFSRLFSIALISAVSGFSLTTPAVAEAPEPTKFGDVQVRFRGIVIAPNEKEDIVPIGGSADVSNEWVPELDITLFLAKNISLELIAAIAEHDIEVQDSVVGDLSIGDVLVLPPTLLLQYHFDLGSYQPYLGAGVNITGFFDEDAATGGPINDFNVETSVGPALQVGMDYFITKNLFINFDAKFIFMNGDITIDTALGPVTADADINPFVFGAGIGWRF